MKNKFNNLQELIKGNVDVTMLLTQKLMHLLQHRNFYLIIIITLLDCI